MRKQKWGGAKCSNSIAIRWLRGTVEVIAQFGEFTNLLFPKWVEVLKEKHRSFQAALIADSLYFSTQNVNTGSVSVLSHKEKAQIL